MMQMYIENDMHHKTLEIFNSTYMNKLLDWLHVLI